MEFLKGKLNQLPASSKGIEFIRQVNNHQVLVIEGATGSGKTMYFPSLLAEVKQGQGQVICTQNRRVLCESGANFISSEMDDLYFAGYKHGKGKKQGKNLVFKSTGTVLAELKQDQWLCGTSAVMVDEIHECTLEQNLLLGHLKRIAASNPNFRVVLMSATLSAEEREHITSFFSDVAFLQVEGRTFPIETIYSGHEIDHTKGWFSLRSQVLEATAESITSLIDEDVKGTVLVFLPGKSEIELVKLMLTKSLQGSVPIYRLFSGVEEPEKEKAVKGSVLKIVLSTDVARSGLTVENCVAVVSSGFSRIANFDGKKGFGGIHTLPSDKASLEQEGGRTGRTCQGKHIIIGKELNRASHSINDQDVSKAILSILAGGFSLPSFEWYHSPSLEQISSTFDLLIRIGAIDDEGITPLGIAIDKLPTDTLIGKLLVDSKKLGVSVLGSKIAAMMIHGIVLDSELSLLNFDFEFMEQNVKDTQAELLQALEDIKIEVKEKGEELTQIKRAFIRTFGDFASVYVPEGLFVQIEGASFGYSLQGNALMRSIHEPNFSIKCQQTKQMVLDNAIVIPLNLFSLENQWIAKSLVTVELEELEREGYNTAALRELQQKVSEKEKQKYNTTKANQNPAWFLFA